MTEDDLTEQAERMLKAALGNRTPHQALVDESRAEADKLEERQAAIAKNRERALKLLAALENPKD